MIKEAYITYETSVLLKEKGFKEPCTGLSKILCKDEEHPVLEITQQKAMRWLREEQNLFIQIQCYGCESDEKAHFEYSYVISEYVRIDNNICTTVGLEQKKAKSRFQSYEEAVEEAIKYCLTNLIK